MDKITYIFLHFYTGLWIELRVEQILLDFPVENNTPQVSVGKNVLVKVVTVM